MYEKYHRSLDLMDACIAVRNDVTECVKSWDALFEYVHANFAIPETVEWARSSEEAKKRESDLVKPLIYGDYRAPSEELERMIRAIPPEIAEVVWPVAVARYLLRDMNANFDHRASTTFRVFHERYGFMILYC